MGAVDPGPGCAYTVSAALFICSLKGLSHQTTANWGCIYGILGMLVAVVSAYFSAYVCDKGIWLMWVAAVPGLLIGTVSNDAAGQFKFN